MDAAPASPKTLSVNRFLPFWAVFQADIKHALRSWIYRVWVLASFSAAIGYLLYRYGARNIGGLVAGAPEIMGDLLSWIVWGSVTLVIVLTAGTICSERGTMADSVLSRGISRYQYFLGKWTARLALVLCTFFLLALVALTGSVLLLHSETLSATGSLVALASVAALLIMIITCGVTVSALSNNTVVSIAIVWVVLYSAGFILSLLPANYPAPDRALLALPNVLKGHYDWQMISRLIAGSLAISLFVALFGMILFSRRDV